MMIQTVIISLLFLLSGTSCTISPIAFKHAPLENSQKNNNPTISTTQDSSSSLNSEQQLNKALQKDPAHFLELLPVTNSQAQQEHIQGSFTANKENIHLETKKTFYLHGAEHLQLKNNYFDIPIVYNESVKKWIHYFLTKGRPFFERYGQRAGRYAPLMGEIMEKMGLPRDLIFVAMNESGFQNAARSYALAEGTWQFMSFTGKKFGLEINWFLDERRDPLKSTLAAAKYLKYLYSLFNNWELAMAAYNAGEGKIQRAINKYKTANFWKLIKSGRYLKPETKNYVPKIMAMAIIGKNLSSFGLEHIDFMKPLDFATVPVNEGTDLYEVAKDLNIDFQELKKLNPEITLWFTPIEENKYPLRIPKSHVDRWMEVCASKKYHALNNFKTYKVTSKKVSVTTIAQKFKVPKEALMALNGLEGHQHLIGQGTGLLLPYHRNDSLNESLYRLAFDKKRKRPYRKMSKKKTKRMAYKTKNKTK